MTEHAEHRMASRGISQRALKAALQYGSVRFTRKAWYYRITRLDVQKCKNQGVNIAEFEGIHVVVSPDGAVLTAYRARKKRRLKPEDDEPNKHFALFDYYNPQ